MSHSIKIAAIQMDAGLAPTPESLRRAERLTGEAVQAGAELVVLPELFNTGYGYTVENFRRAEPITGQTVSWLKEMVARYHIHLAGSLMLLDEREIYDTLLLVAPDGRMWRYDKSYPWGWERAYFRGRKGLTIAQTALGDIGLMICWDTAHRELWRQYAGRINLMVISSCPPDVTHPTFILQNGDEVTFDDLGKMGSRFKVTGRLLFGDMINQQTAWLGIPSVQAAGSGHIRTGIPNGWLSLLAYLPLAPKLVRYLPQGRSMQLETDFVQGCRIVDRRGQVQAELEQAHGETWTIAEVQVPDERPKPARPQPKSLLPRIAYLASDVILPLCMRPVYRQGVQELFERE
jgi:hypothetical protein